MKKYVQSYFWLPAVIGILLYSQTLWFGSAWGDDTVVIESQAKNFHLVFESFFRQITCKDFDPFRTLQCFVINSFFKEHAYPFGFHFYNLFLLFISCLLAVNILFKITNNKLFSILIVTLWVVHPINVQVIVRLGCGPFQLACAAFGLAFTFCFLKIREVEKPFNQFVFSLLGIFFFLASVTSIEQCLFFPFVLFLIFFYLEGKNIFLVKKYLYFFILPLILVYPLYFAWRYYAFGGKLFYAGYDFTPWTEMGSIKDVLFRTFWLAPQLIVHYFRLFFWPDYLSESKATWYIVGDSLFSPYSLFCQALVLVLIVSAVVLYRKIPLFTIGITWFFFSMILVLQIIPLFNIVDEHYCYLAGLGLLLAIFSLINFSLKNFHPKLLVICILPIFCILTWRTMLYIPFGKSLLTRYIYAANEAPDFLRPKYMSLAINLAHVENRLNELPSWINEKNVVKETNKWIENNLNIEPVLSYKFGPIQFLYNYYFYRTIFMVLYSTNRQKELKVFLTQALKVKNNWLGWYECARFFSKIGQWQDAWEALKVAISQKPDHNLSHGQLFIDIAYNANKLSEAEELVRKFVQAQSKSAYPYLFAGKLYKTFGKKEEAAYYFLQSISNDKVSTIWYEFYMAAAEFFIENKLYNEAEKTLRYLLTLDPFETNAKLKLQYVEKAKEKLRIK